MNKNSKAIILQINIQDASAFHRWGSYESLESFPSDGISLGSVRFKVRKLPAFKGTAYISISLNKDDKYDVKLYKYRNHTKKQTEKLMSGEFTENDLERVYDKREVLADQLVATIDEMVGLK